MTPLAGVSEVVVDYAAKTATVTCDDSFDVENAIAQLAEAGYEGVTVAE